MASSYVCILSVAKYRWARSSLILRYTRSLFVSCVAVAAPRKSAAHIRAADLCGEPRVTYSRPATGQRVLPSSRRNLEPQQSCMAHWKQTRTCRILSDHKQQGCYSQGHQKNTPKSKTGGSEGGGAPQPGPPPTGGGGAPGRQSGGGAKIEPEPRLSGGAPAGSGGGANGGRNPGTKPRRRRGSNAGKPEPALKKPKSTKLLETIQKLNTERDSDAANKSDNNKSEESEADSTSDPEM